MATPTKRQILVVDDEPSVRQTVGRLLLSAGYDVASAEEGFRALLELRKTVPDVIISDLNMPHMSGYEFLSVVRRRLPQVMAVAMSGDYQGGAVPDGVIADRFFAKGQRPNVLLATIEALIWTSDTWVSAHQEHGAPAWIPRNGNDAHGAPYVVVTCTECLRAFELPVGQTTGGEVLETQCDFVRPGTGKTGGPRGQLI